MALIVEDGTGIANANTYVTDAEYVAYAASRGLTIGADETARERELISATDFLEKFRAQYQGVKTVQTNPLQWPRRGAAIDCFAIANNVIPEELKRAQMEAGAYSFGAQLTTNTAQQNVQREKLATLEVTYFYNGSAGDGALDRINQWLQPLFNQNSNNRVLIRV